MPEMLVVKKKHTPAPGIVDGATRTGHPWGNKFPTILLVIDEGLDERKGRVKFE